MNRINLVSFVFLIASVFILASCGGMGGNMPWVYSTPEATASAEKPPEEITPASMDTEQPQDGMMDPSLAKDGDGALFEDQAGEEQDSVETIYDGSLPYFDNRNVKVALLLPLSGEHASLGTAMLNAAQLALFDIGQNSFELLPRDTRGTPEGARNAARDVVNEGAQLILGPLFSSSVDAVRSVASRENINVIGFSTDWSLAGGNVFVMGFLPFDQIERLVQYISKNSDIQNVGIIAPDSDYGRVVTSAYQKISTYYGMPPAEASLFSSESKNLAPVIREFTKFDDRNAAEEMQALERFQGVTDPSLLEELKKVSEPIEIPAAYHAVLMPVGGETALSISNLLSHFDMPPREVRRLGTGLLDDEGLASEQSLDGAWFAAPSPNLRTSFETRYRDLYGSQPPRLSSLAYDATALAVVLARNGIKNRGRPDFSRSAIMNRNGFSGIDGIFRFRGNGTVERGLAILEFDNGSIKIIEEAPNTFQLMRQQP